jgi:hypothetical protein
MKMLNILHQTNLTPRTHNNSMDGKIKIPLIAIQIPSSPSLKTWLQFYPQSAKPHPARQQSDTAPQTDTHCMPHGYSPARSTPHHTTTFAVASVLDPPTFAPSMLTLSGQVYQTQHCSDRRRFASSCSGSRWSGSLCEFLVEWGLW